MASTLATAYEKDGYFFPYDVTSEAEAAELLADLQAAEAEVAEDRARLSHLRSYPSQLLPSFARLIRNPRLIEAVSQIIGPDLLVWSCGFFIKAPGSKSYVSWHQDLNYWGLDGDDEVTAWYALTPATVENGCMRMLPGSHRRKDVPHVDSFAPDNLLTRGQEIAVEVDASKAVDIILAPGEISLHDIKLVHGSEPNRSQDRRIGLAVRYLPTHVRQTKGRDSAMLVRGVDCHGNFDLEPSPRADLDPQALAAHANALDRKFAVLYQGTSQTDYRA